MDSTGSSRSDAAEGRSSATPTSAALAAAEVDATNQDAAAAAIATVVGSWSGRPGLRRRVRPGPSSADPSLPVLRGRRADPRARTTSAARASPAPTSTAAEAAPALAQRVVESTVDALPPGTSVAEAAAAGYAVMEDAGDTLRDGGLDRGAFEHSVVITDGAAQILSVAPDRFSGR